MNWHVRRWRTNAAHRCRPSARLARSTLRQLGEFSNNDANRFTARTQYERPLNASHAIAAGLELQRAEFDYETRVRYRSCSRFTPECEARSRPDDGGRDEAIVDSASVFIEDRWALSRTLRVTLGLRGEHQDYLDASYLEPRARGAMADESALGGRMRNGGNITSNRALARSCRYSATRISIRSKRLTTCSASRIASIQRGPGASTSITRICDNVVVDVPTDERYVNGASGEAYGAEFMLNKNRAPYEPGSSDRFYGWFALGLAKTHRDNDIAGTSAVFDYDVPVVANLVVNYRWNRAWDAGLRWTFRSGMPYTPIVGNHENPDFPGYYLPTLWRVEFDREPRPITVSICASSDSSSAIGCAAASTSTSSMLMHARTAARSNTSRFRTLRAMSSKRKTHCRCCLRSASS